MPMVPIERALRPSGRLRCSVSRPSTIGARLTLSVVYESLGATLQFETTRAAYSDRHDYLAYMLVAFQVAMGLDDVIEGEDLVNDRVQGA